MSMTFVLPQRHHIIPFFQNLGHARVQICSATISALLTKDGYCYLSWRLTALVTFLLLKYKKIEIELPAYFVALPAANSRVNNHPPLVEFILHIPPSYRHPFVIDKLQGNSSILIVTHYPPPHTFTMFSGVRRRQAEVAIHRHEYPCALNFYNSPPDLEITLSEFETFALDRLQVLKAIESAHIRSKNEVETDKHIDAVTKKHLPLTPDSEAAMSAGGRNGANIAKYLDEERRKDHVSHFILRLAYCRTEDLRNWFLRQETTLFRHRWRKADALSRKKFLSHVQLSIDEVSPEEKKLLAAELYNSHRHVFANREEMMATSFYKVPFAQVLDLVARRSVFLRAGFAYVPQTQQEVLVCNQFREHLAQALESTARALPRMEEDDRLVPILNSVSKQYMSKSSYENNGTPVDHITAGDVDGLASHFPLCMKYLHTRLREDAHLKHMGRMQFGLFLKGLGLKLEEALVYWRKAFRAMTDDQFQKGYAYNIRHNYGTEGKRTNYTPYSCMKIITTNHPGPGDQHGCPYRHFSSDNLKHLLLREGLADGQANEVTKLAKDGHYQIACTRVFELTKNAALVKKEAAANAAATAATNNGGMAGTEGGMIESITHPNQYFEMSYHGSSNRNKSGKGGVKEEAGANGVEVMAVDR